MTEQYWSVKYLDNRTKIAGMFIINPITDGISIFVDMGADGKPGFERGDFQLNFKRDACHKLLDLLKGACEAAKKGDKVWIKSEYGEVWYRAGFAEFAGSDKGFQDGKDRQWPPGHILVHMYRGKIRLTARFDPRTEYDDYVVTFDPKACGELISAIESGLAAGVDKGRG